MPTKAQIKKAAAAAAKSGAERIAAAAATTVTVHGAARHAATLAAMRYPYGKQSDRDDGYCASTIAVTGGRNVTFNHDDIKRYFHNADDPKASHNTFARAAGAASAPSADAGAFERAVKAGFLTYHAATATYAYATSVSPDNGDVTEHGFDYCTARYHAAVTAHPELAHDFEAQS